MLKRKPIWTAFITHRIRLLYGTKSTVLLADVQQYIFTSDYNSQTSPTGRLELNFWDSEGTAPCLLSLKYMLIESDAEEFVEAVRKLADDVTAIFSETYEILLQVKTVKESPSSSPSKKITALQEGSITIASSPERLGYCSPPTCIIIANLNLANVEQNKWKNDSVYGAPFLGPLGHMRGRV